MTPGNVVNFQQNALEQHVITGNGSNWCNLHDFMKLKEYFLKFENTQLPTAYCTMDVNLKDSHVHSAFDGILKFAV